MSKPVFQDLMNFEGRRNRQSYVFFIIVLIPALAIAFRIAAATESSLLLALLLTPIYVSGWAVCSQRLRDIGLSGWWVLATLTPVVGIIFTVFVAFQPGTAGPNRFGPDPLEGEPQKQRWY